MQNSKLLNLFKSFSPDEWKAFGLFLQSPYHNTSEQVLLLYGHLENCYPEFLPEQVNRQKLYSVIYLNEQEYVDRRLRDLFSKMGKLAHSFLAVEQLKKDSSLVERLTIEALSDHQKYEEANKKSDTLIHLLEKSSQKKLIDYSHLQWLYHNRYFNAKSAQQALLNAPLEKAYKNIDLQFYLHKLRYTSEFLVRSLQLQEELPFDEKEINRLIEQCKPLQKENIALQCYQLLIQISQQPTRYSWRHYETLKAIFFSNWQQLDKMDMQFFYKHLYNYLVQMSRLDETLSEPEKLELYQFLMDNNLLLQSVELTIASFINIAFMGIKAGKFDWSESFILKYQEYLPDEERGSVVALVLGALHFYKKEWTRARELVSGLNFKDPNLELAKRSLLLRIFFEYYVETGRGEVSFSSHADAFSHFLSRKSKIKRAKARPYKNLIRFTIRLSKLKNSANKKRVESLQKAVQECASLSFKPWVLEHIKKLTP